MVELRRQIHAYPELAYEEHATADLVAQRLARWGYEVHRGLGEMQTLATGVGDLKRVLTNVKSRGTFGEVQLASLLEQHREIARLPGLGEEAVDQGRILREGGVEASAGDRIEAVGFIDLGEGYPTLRVAAVRKTAAGELPAQRPLTLHGRGSASTARALPWMPGYARIACDGFVDGQPRESHRDVLDAGPRVEQVRVAVAPDVTGLAHRDHEVRRIGAGEIDEGGEHVDEVARVVAELAGVTDLAGPMSDPG